MAEDRIPAPTGCEYEGEWIHMIKAAFVDFSRYIFDRHHIYTLATFLRSNGIDVRYINEKYFPDAIREVSRLQPDLLMYSAVSTDIDIYSRFDKAVKTAFPAKSIIGGAGPTFDLGLGQKSTIDAFCVGEGEIALLEFIRNGLSGGRNIVLNGETEPKGLHRLVDLDTLPIPDRTLVYGKNRILKHMSTKQFMMGRGCPYHCTYCHNHQFHKMFRDCGALVRVKSVGYVIEEVLYTKRKYPFRNLLFHDDIFMADRKWLFEFCERFPREVGLRYAILARANNFNEETVRALSESGCSFVSWSIECASDDIRNKVLKRNMTREQIENAGYLLNKYKVPHKIGNMLGLPGETLDDMVDTLRLNVKIRPNIGLATIFTPYPGLEITRYAVDNGFVDREKLNHLPRDYFTSTVMNYSERDKRRISRLAWFFPILVDFPALLRKKKIFGFLLDSRLPDALCRIAFEIYYLYKYSRAFRVKTSWYVKLLVLAAHLSEKLRVHAPDKGCRP